MTEFEEYLLHYQKLLDLLEEDSQNIKKGLQDDLLDAYREVIQKEKLLLEQNLSSIKRQL